ADGRGCAVSVDVADYAGRDAGVAHGVAHDAESAFMFGSGLGHVVGVGGHAVADDFGEDGRAALASVLQLFEDHDARAFAHDEAVASLIPGAAGSLGLVVAGGKRAHGGESPDAHGCDGGFGAAGDHHVGVVVLDDAEGIADGMGAGGAGRGRGLIRSLGAVTHGDVPGGQVDDGGGNEERRDFARPAFDQCGVLALNDVESADAGPDMHADMLGVLRGDLQFRHLERFVAGGDSQVDEAPHLLQFFFFDVVQRVEVLDLGGDLAGKVAGVETGNAGHAALAGDERLPHFFGGIAHAADQAEPRDYDPASQLFSRLGVLADVVNRVLHGADFFRVFVGNLDVEGFFEGHDQFDRVQRIGAQIVHERRAGGDFAFIHSQLLHDDLFYLVVYGCHVFPRLPLYRFEFGSAVAQPVCLPVGLCPLHLAHLNHGERKSANV